MDVAIWFIILGFLFLFISISNSWLQRAPLTTSLIYLIIGVSLGPYGLKILQLNMFAHSKFLEHLCEVAVIVSLFNAGLKMRLPLNHKFWRLPIALASISMIIGVGLTAFASHWLLDFSWPAAILLGAILSPTDPVLASDVQVQHPNDHDELRFTLTCEAGLNDGTAFPFVMLALVLMGLEGSHQTLNDWLIYDVLWAITAGIGIGVLVGLSLGWLEKNFRPYVQEIEVLNDFLALALICLAYGLSLSVKAYGFLAVFTAGIVVRQLEMRTPIWHIKHSLQKMSDGVLFFNEQFERLLEVAVVIALGSMLQLSHFSKSTLIIGGGLIFLIRPLSVFIVGLPMGQKYKRLSLISWFGIRGIGSLYYLAYTITHGISESLANELIGLVFSLVAISTVIHGLSVTSLMQRRWKWKI